MSFFLFNFHDVKNLLQWKLGSQISVIPTLSRLKFHFRLCGGCWNVCMCTRMENNSVTDLGWLWDHRKRNRVTAKRVAEEAQAPFHNLRRPSCGVYRCASTSRCEETITLPVIEHSKRKSEPFLVIRIPNFRSARNFCPNFSQKKNYLIQIFLALKG